MQAFHGESPPCHVGGNWAGASGDIKYLICHMTSQNHVIEGSINFISGNYSWCVITLPGAMAESVAVVEI